MSRNDSMTRLHKCLLSRREELLRQLAEDLDQTHSDNANSGDPVDAAQEGSQCEIHSQLAAFESRELHQIDRAIEQLREGRYGICEECRTRIPVARLKALPFTTTCVRCAQANRSHHGMSGRSSGRTWTTTSDYGDDLDLSKLSEELSAEYQ